MPFYFLAVRPWVNDMKKVACIELAGPNNGSGTLMDLSDVTSVNDLMVKKAIPIRNFTFKYAKDLEKGEARGGIMVSDFERITGRKDETLGELLEREKAARKLKKEQKLNRSLSSSAVKKYMAQAMLHCLMLVAED